MKLESIQRDRYSKTAILIFLENHIQMRNKLEQDKMLLIKSATVLQFMA